MSRVAPEKVMLKCVHVVGTQAAKLTNTVKQAQELLENNNLNAAEVEFYKTSIKTANKMVAALDKVAEIESVGEPPPRKRGRPPKVHAEDAEPKKRGRPPKAESAEAAPKKRGRPKKVVEAVTSTEAPKRRGRPPKIQTEQAAAAPAEAPKKRGRPKGSKNKPKELQITA